MIHDIEKMRADFEKKIEICIKENELNKGLKGYYYQIYDDTIHFHNEDIMKRYASIENVYETLLKFPKTNNILYDNKFNLPYVIHSSRSYGDKCGNISLQWQSGEYKIYIDIEITDEIINNFFKVNTRPVNDCESSTYASIQHYNEFGHKQIYKVPQYDFLCEQKRYYGGTNLLLDNNEIMRFMEYIELIYNKEI
jgi:hypothetical protein